MKKATVSIGKINCYLCTRNTNFFSYRTFHKGGIPAVGDEVEFEGHIVTIESFESTEIVNNTAQTLLQPHQPTPTPTPPPMARAPPPQPANPPQPGSNGFSKFKPPTMIPRKRIIKPDPEEDEEEEEDDTPSFSNINNANPSSNNPPLQTNNNQPKEQSAAPPNNQKRIRVGLSKRTSSSLHQKLQSSNNIPSTSSSTNIPTTHTSSNTYASASAPTTTNTHSP